MNKVKEYLLIFRLQNTNKSNSTAGAVQVEENLQEQFSDQLHFKKLKCC